MRPLLAFLAAAFGRLVARGLLNGWLMSVRSIWSSVDRRPVAVN